jgi:hypothetical protein
MHSAVTATRRFAGSVAALLAAFGLVRGAAAQNPVSPPGPIAQAEALLRAGRVEDAELLLNKHVASQPNDGKAWLFLGRIYLGAARDWHTSGHPGASGPILLDFATQTIEQAQQRVIDSSDVYRVVIEIERATNRIEEVGWERGVAVAIAPEDLPLPPVLQEFGRNLVASCPDRGVLLAGGLIETTAAWSARLHTGGRSDLIVIRPDLYATDSRYRTQMARALGVDSTATLAAALVQAGATRPICLSPTLDSLAVGPLAWHPMRIALVGGRLRDADNATPMSVFQLARIGLSTTVWGAPVRDLYELAARRNHVLCTSLFNKPDAQGLPPILACQQ